MAKIEKKSKNEPKKKSSKAATVKCRTTRSQAKKTVGRAKLKSAAEVGKSRQSNNSGKAAKSGVTKTVAKKTTSAKPVSVKKRVAQAKGASKVKRAVAGTMAVKSPIPAKNHPLERKIASTEELRAMLLERRMGILKSFDEEIAAPQEEDLMSVVVGDMADLAQGLSENDMFFRLAEVESRELSQIDKALKKIHEGTYGVCESCRENISPARLKALPFANKCIRCQEEEERQNF